MTSCYKTTLFLFLWQGRQRGFPWNIFGLCLLVALGWRLLQCPAWHTWEAMRKSRGLPSAHPQVPRTLSGLFSFQLPESSYAYLMCYFQLFINYFLFFEVGGPGQNKATSSSWNQKSPTLNFFKAKNWEPLVSQKHVLQSWYSVFFFILGRCILKSLMILIK